MLQPPAIIVHAGPSLAGWERPGRPDVVWLPPAVAGDALRAERFNPQVFVLIDGLFDDACAIRHNELLRLMSQGVRVIGGASMGALRAVELGAFGMEGCGRICDAYLEGRLVGDDEVALLHGPADFGWAPLTVPLVNVRASLVAGRRLRMLSAVQARGVLLAAKSVPFGRRTWPTIWSVAAPPTAFAAWVDRTGGVDLKARDALETLARAFESPRRAAAAPPPPPPPPPMTVFNLALARKITE